MANSKITIQFNSVPIYNQSVYFDQHSDITSMFARETFVGQRLGQYQAELPKDITTETSPETIYSGYASDLYKRAFDLDFNTSNLYTVESTRGPAGSGIGTVIITANFAGAVFLNESADGDVTFIIENEPALPAFNITEVNFGQALSTPCQKVRVLVTTDNLAVKVISPVSIDPNTNNPFALDWLRGDTINVIVEDANGKQASKSIVLPSLLSAANFTINVNNSPNGATVLVENANSTGLVLQYSLDNVSWQSSNIFTGLDVGDFVLNVKDQLGCSFTKAFSVNEFGIQSPYFYISKSNSIRYAKRITWGDSENYKTDENTLSCEVDVDVVYKEVQQFQSADIVPTQFKSNYSSNVAKVIREDLSEIVIPIEKKSNNIGIKDKRDARKYSIGGGKAGIYFISGNTYDYNTSSVIGNYSLNGSLPEWGVSGNYIVISNAWFLIEEIVFDESKNSDVIIISENFSGSEISIVVGSIFNRFNYEIYEYFIDMVNFIDQKFHVQLVNSDPNFATITHLSEELWCQVKHEDVVEIKYHNTTNTDVFYATGIEFKIRIPLTSKKGLPEENSEIHKTDTAALLLSADLYEVDQFVFEPVTKEIWRKIMIALSHEKVWLNGVGYVKNGSFSTEGPLEKSNLYVLTANMIKTGNVYNSIGTGNFDLDEGQVEVPGLISTESGYVAY
ncbi:hypothetical protein [Flavobacterium tructae]|uniref:Uncharacterized protein n=1 Tax=Flavobacterium tructae TaxID=1114873 RepID=A0A1S1J3R8_9FLAO|nr:hypothetical protein [Flavobacterium tructae]OHT44420.1 hypothetical protein BHE19_11915 [Flavobacterium tructae]OXB19444.1 hypothetical protein B0A71_12960 [Flavobacterium tructae]